VENVPNRKLHRRLTGINLEGLILRCCWKYKYSENAARDCKRSKAECSAGVSPAVVTASSPTLNIPNRVCQSHI
jgi:hypothetical protein